MNVNDSLQNCDIFEDYRDLLKQYYENRKSEMPLYSYGMMGQRLDLDKSQLFRILSKALHLPNRCVPLAKALLGLTGRSGEIFEILVAAAKTQSKVKRSKLYEMAFNLKNIELRKIEDNELLFLSKWWIPVVRSVIELNGGRVSDEKVPKQIQPNITKSQYAEALKILKILGFISPRASGYFELEKIHFSTTGTPRAKAIRDYQYQLFGLAQNALTQFTLQERNISSLLVSVDEDCFQDLQEMTAEFRRQVQKRIDKVEKSTRVMQLLFALFPVAINEDELK